MPSCQHSEEHPDVAVSWSEDARGCPLCAARRTARRESYKRTSVAAKLERAREVVKRWETFSACLPDAGFDSPEDVIEAIRSIGDMAEARQRMQAQVRDMGEAIDELRRDDARRQVLVDDIRERQDAVLEMTAHVERLESLVKSYRVYYMTNSGQKHLLNDPDAQMAADRLALGIADLAAEIAFKVMSSRPTN